MRIHGLTLLTLMLISLATLFFVTSSRNGYEGRAYLIFIPSGAFRDVSPSLLQPLSSYLTDNGMEISVIRNFTSFRSILANASAGDLIINLHGSAIPVPMPYALSGEEGALNFLRDLAVNMSKRGFTFINLAGLPFSYAFNDEEHLSVELGETGVSTFFNALNFSVKVNGYIERAGSLDYAMLTFEGANASKIAGTSLPTKVSATYSISTNVDPFFTLYSTETIGYLGAFKTVAAYSLGKGYYVHVGVWHEPDFVKADIALTSLIYLHVLLNSEPDVYLLAINDTAWYGLDMPSTLAYIGDQLSSMNLSYHVVNSSVDLYRLISSDVRGITLINLHGAVMPIPDEYLITDGTAPAYAYISDLALCVRDKGWILVNIAGYPFSIVANGHAHYWSLLEEGGLAAFLSAASNFTVGGFCWNGMTDRPLAAVLTDIGLKLVNELNISPWNVWAAVMAPNSLKTSAPCLFSLYDTFVTVGDERYQAVAAVMCGKGIFAFSVLDQSTPESVKATVGYLLALMTKRRQLFIQVLDIDSKPVSGVNIRVLIEGNTTIINDLTNAKGWLNLTLSGGRYTLIAEHEGYAPTVTSLDLTVSPESVKMIMEPIQLRAHVVDLLTGDPVPNAQVIVMDNRGTVLSSSYTDVNGCVSFNLPAGIYQVKVSAENYTEYLNPSVELDGITYLEVHLKKLISGVYIRIIDPVKGDVVPFANIKVYGDGRLLFAGKANDEGLVKLNLVNVTSLIIEVYDDDLLVGKSDITVYGLTSLIIDVPAFTDIKYKSLYEREVEKYLSLKRNYNSLLSKYNSLNTKYNSLKDTYAELNETYSSLLEEFQRLEKDYLELRNKYLRLNANFNQLSTNYTLALMNLGNLTRDYEQLRFKLLQLNVTYAQLLEDYHTLLGKYDSLRAWNQTLTAKYEELSKVKERYEGAKRTWPVISSVIAVLGVACGTALGYAYGKRKGEYIVINP